MLVTFVFLGLNTVLQPFCTLPLSRLQSFSLLAQILTLFGGLMLILQVCFVETKICCNLVIVVGGSGWKSSD
jgi:hypothetical protein